MLTLSAIAAPALLIALSVLAAACAVVWGVVLVHALLTALRLPTAAAGLAAAAREETVCVVVPAHNEAGCIGRLVDSFRAQDHPGARFVLALDRCTDDTAAIARDRIGGDARFEIVEIDACPDGWAGKVHAARAGVERSRGAADADLLVFTDADCAFHPGCLRATSALLHGRGLDLLSLLSTLETRGFFEWVAQPSATLELVRQYPLLRANRAGRSRRPFANGQFMMFRAGAYRAVGGHEAVRDALLEDIAFARLLSLPRHGLRTGLLLAGGMVRCRMYENGAQFRTGWKRIYTESLNRRSARMRAAAWRVRAMGTALPLAAAACLAAALVIDPADGALGDFALIAALAGLGAWAAAWAVVLVSGRAPLASLPLQVVGAWVVGGILSEGARDLASGTPVRWGGREYVLEDRS